MMLESDWADGAEYGDSVVGRGRWAVRPETARDRILVVEDDDVVREAMAPLLEEQGYEVSAVENGREALRRLQTAHLPDLIVLDLRMPVMNGWEFRTIQKDDPLLGHIPIVAVSADDSAQAAAISADAFLRKPIDTEELLTTVRGLLRENKQSTSARLPDTSVPDIEWIASLGRLAANIGHEINNPLAIVTLNLTHSLEALRPTMRSPRAFLSKSPLPEVDIELDDLKARVLDVTEMLKDCQIGGERIRDIVRSLQSLSHEDEEARLILDVHELIEQSVSQAWNQIRPRARVIRCFGRVPSLRGNSGTLGRVFLNLLVNAAQSIPEGHPERNEIRVSTYVCPGEDRAELVVEIRDSGEGITPEIVPKVFEPFFTTKVTGKSAGLGLSVSLQTVSDHGGRMTLESTPGKGTVFRVFLPVAESPALPRTVVASTGRTERSRGRILIIDNEPVVGRIIASELKSEHDVVVVLSVSEGVARLEHGETFDLVLCDIDMPGLGGPDLHAAIAERWPDLLTGLVFMTDDDTTSENLGFMDRLHMWTVPKPLKIERLKELVCKRMEHSNG
jgi:signal transduction histidine kinase